MRYMRFIFICMMLMSGTWAFAGDLQVSLAPEAGNPVAPVMGDWVHFRTEITNTGLKSAEGLVAWISLVEVTPGREQPMDLEDWSAHKAVSASTLDPGGKIVTTWPLRLIQSGDYRVVISVTDRNDQTVITSPALGFHVRQKPVLESAKILPVALGIPFLIGAAMLGLRLRSRRV